MDYYLGIDFGTTNCKCIVYDKTLRSYGSCSVPNTVQYRGKDIAEQPAEEWWATVWDAIKGALADAAVSGNSIRSMAVSSQGISFVPVDADYRPLRPGISWLDTRAKEEMALLSRLVSLSDIQAISGICPTPAYILPKLLWLRQNEPKIWAKTTKLLTPHDWIVYKLCGRAVIPATMAAGTLLYQYREKNWSDQLMNCFALSPQLFGELVWSGETIGTVTVETAAALGISPQTQVVAGGQDQKCAYLGAGASTDTVTISLGTAAALSKRCETAREDPSGLISCSPYLTKDGWILEGVVGTAGACLEWAQRRFFPSVRYATLDARAAERYHNGLNSLLFNPDFAYVNEKTTLPAGGFSGLSLSVTEDDIWLAVLEGIAFRIRERLEIINGLGQPAKVLRLFGGGAKSRLWQQIIADVTGLPTEVCTSDETGCLGAAMLAAGIPGGNLKAASVCFPDPVHVAAYDLKYKQFLAAFH